MARISSDVIFLDSICGAKLFRAGIGIVVLLDGMAFELLGDKLEFILCKLPLLPMFIFLNISSVGLGAALGGFGRPESLEGAMGALKSSKSTSGGATATGAGTDRLFGMDEAVEGILGVVRLRAWALNLAASEGARVLVLAGDRPFTSACGGAVCS